MSELSEDIKIVHLKSKQQRIETWIAMLDGSVVGHIYMDVEDHGKIKFLDAWVQEDHRRKGIFRALWDTRWKYCKQKYSGWIVYAWCKEKSLPLLLEKGFEAGEISTYVEKEIN